MFHRLIVAAFCVIFFFGLVQGSYAQEPEEEGFVIIEEEIEPEFKTELQEEEQKTRFITSEVLTAKEVKPAIEFYIRTDISQKFLGLITDLNLGKIYGVMQEGKTATVYFDYNYVSVRNKDNILYEKGKITFVKFNSGKWFNAELSIFLLDSYPMAIKKEQQEKEE